MENSEIVANEKQGMPPQMNEQPSNEGAQAEKNQQAKRTPPAFYQKSVPREVAEILLFALCVLLFFKSFVWQNFQIPTPSMENSLLIGDHLTANTFIFKNAGPIERALLPYRDIRRGDVVVFKWPGDPRQDYIKRCIGLPGERFEVKADRVYVNGSYLDERYTFFKEPKTMKSDRDPEIGYRPRGYYEIKPGFGNGWHRPPHESSFTMIEMKNVTLKVLEPYKTLDAALHEQIVERLRAAPVDEIPEGFYVMMGDNRNRSYDSREWGLVPRELIQGRGYFVWWSYGEDENSHTKEGLDLIHSYVRVIWEGHKRTRWEESFSRIK
ncbi:signal peptidase I [Acanthopleuribacter pedis]|uniref:Signal peptidase I n=1 Tax=Acanthopleuribacter pedis TaxID=442870 RepID=A0A8J7QA65_9BACT|nr:signal peptidase I [Acanthopleuribacter pedis]MBO1319879.1 signal peptidase I [Acanthopleuribacter pedis]